MLLCSLQSCCCVLICHVSVKWLIYWIICHVNTCNINIIIIVNAMMFTVLISDDCWTGVQVSVTRLRFICPPSWPTVTTCCSQCTTWVVSASWSSEHSWRQSSATHGCHCCATAACSRASSACLCPLRSRRLIIPCCTQRSSYRTWSGSTTTKDCSLSPWTPFHPFTHW